MATPRQILVNRLLLEREALWVRVHEIEREAAKWLGEPFPFERPELPSDRKRKRRSGAPAGPVTRAECSPVSERASASHATPPLRGLDAGEAGYRVSYVTHGRAATEEHDDPEALRVLLDSQGAHLRVTRIETIDGSGSVLAELFSAQNQLAEGLAPMPAGSCAGSRP